MSSIRRGRLLPIVVLVSAVAAVLFCWYLVTKPQRDGRRIVHALKEVEVERTSTEQLDSILSRYQMQGMATVTCVGDLEKLVHHPGTPELPMPGVYPSIPQQDLKCSYGFEAENGILQRLHLADPVRLLAEVVVRKRIVTNLTVLFDSENTHVEVKQGGSDTPEFYTVRCPQDVCVWNPNPGEALISLLPSVPLVERNRLLSVDTSCLAMKARCENVHELLPIAEIRAR